MKTASNTSKASRASQVQLSTNYMSSSEMRRLLRVMRTHTSMTYDTDEYPYLEVVTVVKVVIVDSDGCDGSMLHAGMQYSRLLG